MVVVVDVDVICKVDGVVAAGFENGAGRLAVPNNGARGEYEAGCSRCSSSSSSSSDEYRSSSPH